jgi:hypothetical protein
MVYIKTWSLKIMDYKNPIKKTHWNHGYLTVVFENPINIPSRKNII